MICARFNLIYAILPPSSSDEISRALRTTSPPVFRLR